MIKKDVSYSDIKSFLVVVETGSFTNAAEVLLCSRSQVSKQLSQLEASLGTSLMVRTTRTQHLTAVGEAFYQRCKQAFSGIDYAIDMAMESTNSVAGKIKINSVGGYIGESIIGPLVSEFMKMNPQISVTLDFSSRRVDLVSGEFDFVFRMGELVDSALIARKLTDIKIGTYASPKYIEKYGKPNDPKALAHHKCISGSMHSWLFNNINSKETQEVQVKGELDCRNGRVMLHSALSGNGIIRVPDIYCTKEVTEKQLVPIFDDWKIKPTPFYLVYLQDKHQPLRITAFKEFVIEHFNKFYK